MLQQVNSAAQLKQIFEDLLKAYDAHCSVPAAATAHSSAAMGMTTTSSATAVGVAEPAAAAAVTPSVAEGWSPPAVPQSVAAAERHTLQQEALAELMAHT